MVYDVGEGEGHTVLELSGVATSTAISEPIDTVSESDVDRSESTSGFEGPIEVVISFDTTGSMYPCLTQVRSHIRTMIRDLFASIPRIRMGVIAQGDYDDRYETQHTGLSNNQNELCHFVENVSSTNGYDYAECYELVLREKKNQLDFRGA